jgi:hypothetical protein
LVPSKICVHLLSELSGGQQRVAIARALIARPKAVSPTGTAVRCGLAGCCSAPTVYGRAVCGQVKRAG